MPDTQNASAAQGDPVITVAQLSKSYRSGWFRRSLPALRNVSFEVQRGEVFGLLGPNGAGKTTFLKILLGIIRKSGGNASLLGFPAGSRQGRRRVGYLPEQLRVPRHLTGETALDYYGRLSGLASSTVRGKRNALFEFVGLGNRGRDATSKYSKGMLQRLGLAQALLHEPDLLILDEPTDGLDPGARAEMRGLIRDLRDRGVTVFLNSHLLQEVEQVCDRVAILNRGELRYCGRVEEIGGFVHGDRGGTWVVTLIVSDPTAAQSVLKTGLASANDPAPSIEVGEVTTPDGRAPVSLSVGSQDQVDKAIDCLRSADISIFSLHKQSTSLEEAFLRIVREPDKSPL